MSRQSATPQLDKISHKFIYIIIQIIEKMGRFTLNQSIWKK